MHDLSKTESQNKRRGNGGVESQFFCLEAFQEATAGSRCQFNRFSSCSHPSRLSLHDVSLHSFHFFFMRLDSSIDIFFISTQTRSLNFALQPSMSVFFFCLFSPFSRFPVSGNFNSETWRMPNNQELAGVLLVSPHPTCSVFVCPWLEADQIIGSKPSIGQRRRPRRRPPHSSLRLMQPDGRRKRRRWGRSLHTNPSLITVRAPLTDPSRPHNEFVR